MHQVRLHPGTPFDPSAEGSHAHSARPNQPTPTPNPRRNCGPGSDCRMNLLLSYAGWHNDPWVERLPRLLEPMGIQSFRCQTGAEATRVIQNTSIHIAVVDLGLPLNDTSEPDRIEDEGGPRLLELLTRLSEPPPVVAVKRARSQRDDTREIAAALRLGAFAVVNRPRDICDLDLMLDVLRRCLDRHYRGKWPNANFPV